MASQGNAGMDVRWPGIDANGRARRGRLDEARQPEATRRMESRGRCGGERRCSARHGRGWIGSAGQAGPRLGDASNGHARQGRCAVALLGLDGAGMERQAAMCPHRLGLPRDRMGRHGGAGHARRVGKGWATRRNAGAQSVGVGGIDTPVIVRRGWQCNAGTGWTWLVEGRPGSLGSARER